MALIVGCLASCKNNETVEPVSTTDEDMMTKTDTAYVVPADSTVIDSTTMVNP
ncbi:hypothetical protein [Flavobacterium agrisoli]|uniref:Uncharacterized protein n=1 Tax=Flavobacterium agrisoli TaxID=2793066 RepID=A0A934PLU8_9FLAO|nr:hypothetical protein [Flavobacterium agrisoli]MBK0369323.1 hypothetical protein [Flavobacterium agrisoli]